MPTIKGVFQRLSRVCKSTFTGRNLANVVMYHGVAPAKSPYNGRHVPIADFVSQLQFYKANFAVVSLSDLFSHHDPSSRPALAITFDDGYFNNFEYAASILEEYKCPASFFVVAHELSGFDILWSDLLDIAPRLTRREICFGGETFSNPRMRSWGNSKSGPLKRVYKSDPRGGAIKITEIAQQLEDVIERISQDRKIGDYWKLMSGDDLRQLSTSDYISLGIHGVYHNNLGVVPIDAAQEEVKRSQQYLEGLTRTKIGQISYPDGSYSRDLVEAVCQLGIDQQCAVDYRFPQDRSDVRLCNRYGVHVGRNGPPSNKNIKSHLCSL